MAQGLDFAGRDDEVVLCLMVEHRTSQGGERVQRNLAIERDTAAELPARGREVQRVECAHIKAEDRDPIFLHVVLIVQILNGGCQILHQGGKIHLRHQLVGMRGFRCDPTACPAVLIHYQRHVAMFGQPKGHLLKMLGQSPALVKNDHGGKGATFLRPRLEASDLHALSAFRRRVRIHGNVQRIRHSRPGRKLHNG